MFTVEYSRSVHYRVHFNLKLTDCQNATAERIKSLIRPDDIDQVFQRLGASPKALAITEPVSPDSSKQQHSFLFQCWIATNTMQQNRFHRREHPTIRQPYFPFLGCFEEQQACRFIPHRFSRPHVLITLKVC